MKSIISLRVREKREFTQVVLQRCNVISADKSRLKSLLFIAVLFLGPLRTATVMGQWDDPNVFGENLYPTVPGRTVVSFITDLTPPVPPGARVSGVEVGFTVSNGHAYLCNWHRYDDSSLWYDLGNSWIGRTDHQFIPDFFDGDIVDDQWILIITKGVSDVRIYNWWIKVYHRDPYPQNISVSPMSHNFWGIRVGETSEPLEITISNTGEQDLNISNIALSDETNFTLDVNGGSNPLGSPNPTIKGGHSGTVTVTFNPKSEGTFDAQLEIISDDLDNSIVTVSLKGRTPQKIFVDSGATGANDGSSWANAYNYLQDALDFAVAEDEICVAEGIYKPDANTVNPNGTGDREATFHLKNGITLYGGFPSGGGIEDRDPNKYETILSGDLNGNDVEVTDPSDLLTEPTRAENSYHVVTGTTGTGTSAVLDGFTITAGNANGYYYPNSSDSGGGMYNYGSPTVARCTFRTNSAFEGGGMFNESFKPTLTNCTFWGNLASGYGGGIYSFQSSESLTNCAFIRNSAEAGGAIGSRIGRLTAVNCTFAGNSAIRGNALACDPTAPPGNLQVVSCILWNGGDEIWNDGGSTITISYSDIQGGWSGPGANNINVDPNLADADNGDFHLLAGSQCIDAGDNSAVPSGITTDLDGKPRFIDDPNTDDNGNGTPPIVDMGAYEFQGIIGDFCGEDPNLPDGYVDYWDLLYFARRWHSSPSDNNWDPRCDLDKEDNYVDYWDLLVFAQNWHEGEPP